MRGRRALLNRPGHHSTSAIVAEVEDTRSWEPGCNRDGDPIDKKWGPASPEVTFCLSDCDRHVSLSFDGFHTAEGRANDLAKIDKVLAAVAEFRRALVSEQRLYVERKRLAR